MPAENLHSHAADCRCSKYILWCPRALIELATTAVLAAEGVVEAVRMVSNADFDLVILRDEYERDGFTLPELIKLIKPELPVLALVPLLIADDHNEADLSTTDSASAVAEALAKLLPPE